VEEQEERLKFDLLSEASKHSGCVLIHDESDDGLLQEHFEEVSPETVLTPKEVYESLVLEGYDVRYQRVPITDEQAPEEGDFGVLVDRVEKATPDQHLVFNCQMGACFGVALCCLVSVCHGVAMYRCHSSLVSPPSLLCSGRGRTTTGMVVACLVMTNDDPKWMTPLPFRESAPGCLCYIYIYICVCVCVCVCVCMLVYVGVFLCVSEYRSSYLRVRLNPCLPTFLV
jgi:Inositol hexakisphosphate